MFSMLAWWYSAGWAGLLQRLAERIGGVGEFFSITLLAKTLFSPFRQIDASGSPGNALKAWGDRLFSRLFGAVMRLILIFVGLLTLLAVSLVSLVQLAIWPLVPLLPIAGIVLSFAKAWL